MHRHEWKRLEARFRSVSTSSPTVSTVGSGARHVMAGQHDEPPALEQLDAVEDFVASVSTPAEATEQWRRNPWWDGWSWSRHSWYGQGWSSDDWRGGWNYMSVVQPATGALSAGNGERAGETSERMPALRQPNQRQRMARRPRPPLPDLYDNGSESDV